MSKDALNRILNIKEKGPGSAKFEDIPLVFDITCQFLNVNPEAQQLIKDLDLSIVVDIECSDPYNMTIKNGICQFDKGSIRNPNFSFNTDLNTITKLLLGLLDPTVGYFSRAFKAEGDLYYMIIFLELLDLAGERLGITKVEEKKTFISTGDMKKLLNVYKEGADTVQPPVIPLFFEVFSTYVNLNPDAQDYISGEDHVILMKIRDVNDYVIQIEEGKMKWYQGSAENYTLKLEMDIETSADVVISGDAVTAYMAGNISIEGNIANGLFFQELIQMFLEFLDLL